MKIIESNLQLSASDLVNHLSCNHLSMLDVELAKGNLSKPDHYDPLLEILRERGQLHEAAFIDHLKNQGFEVVVVDGADISDKSVEATLEAMRTGKQIIVQGALKSGQWVGRADVLRRIETPSNFGSWSYEVIDTKLARETKGGSVLQLCFYADLLASAQGCSPEHVYIVSPWSDYEPQAFRFADYSAYFRQVKKTAIEALTEKEPQPTYPDPKSHCDICRWRTDCDARRRKDDHLCLVANISKTQINELQVNGINTMQALAEMSVPIPFIPQKGSPLTFEKIKKQASVQVEARESGKLKYELTEIRPEVGLATLPEPSAGDVFFDIEGDPFVGEHGLEYLFGYAYLDEGKQLSYENLWAFSREEEKLAFKQFVDFITKRREAFPNMHIYHFAPYEPAALKRLMGRYASRESEVDNFLRGLVFVDLLSVVRNTMFASVESYSIKKLEPFFKFIRQASLHDANVALTKLSACLELNDINSIDDKTKTVVERYNAEDCFATAGLRDWLEEIREELINQGQNVPRPAPGQDAPGEELNGQAIRVQALIDKLTANISVDPEERNQEEQALWLLAYILEWHRREDKAVWWEYFRLRDLTAEDLINERSALSKLIYQENIELSPRGIPTDRYRFEQQDTDLRGDEDLIQLGGEKFGKAVSVCSESRTIDIKKSGKTKDIHPEAVYAHTIFRTKEQAASLYRIGQYIAENGIEGDGVYKSSRELLLRNAPSFVEHSVTNKEESTLDSALRISKEINGGVFPIQGPPGTGKSYTGARMICSLVQQGKKVGITANSHKVIRHLIDEVIKAAREMQINLRCIQKPKEIEPNQDNLIFAKKNEDIFAALASGSVQVAGATHFLWCREDAKDTLDALVVDEAAQMSLANVLAVSPAAPTLILLGDPQQLEQPTQGSHPDGTGVSALDHILNGQQTISQDQGLFLGVTWRLHPEICAYNSELFYESKLTSIDGCELQTITSDGLLNGTGLRHLSVHHSGNTSSSIEEAEAVMSLVHLILSENTKWTDRNDVTKEVTYEDIVVIAPYNAQVFEIQQRLPEARVGTVDKFQGQEAPIAIYSMATSSYADAPRGMEFLYSANRVNVAISRAKCMAILVASPKVFNAECKTPRQMQLANAFCRYLELALPIDSGL